MCLSINESVIEVEPLPGVTTLRRASMQPEDLASPAALGFAAAGSARSSATALPKRDGAAAATGIDIERSAVQDKKSSPTLVPETPNAV